MAAAAMSLELHEGGSHAVRNGRARAAGRWQRSQELADTFTIGFCIEEQAVAQAGDDRYSLGRRAERVDATAHPLAAEAGPAIFGDPDARFADLVAILVDAVGRLRAGAGEVI
jgi:hypothetical protein